MNFTDKRITELENIAKASEERLTVNEALIHEMAGTIKDLEDRLTNAVMFGHIETTKPSPDPEGGNCQKCGVWIPKQCGGTIFTRCENCWDDTKDEPKISRLKIRLAIQSAILEFQVNDYSIIAMKLKNSKERCLVDVITDAVYKEINK